MKRNILIAILFFVSVFSFGQEKKVKPYKSGEWLEYKMSYSGFLKAGTATLELKETLLDGKKVFYAKGFGKTSTFVGWFFKVRDTYESYFDKEDSKPYLFKRDVNEGGHIIKRDTKFDHKNKIATIHDYKYKTVKQAEIGDVQDMISTFYYLRNIKTDTLKSGDEISLDMFFDSKTFPFKLKFLGTEILKTRFGKIKTLKFRPIVQAGRVFKENESVTIWVTADDNKIPIKLKAALAVGSLRAELKAFKGLANSFKIIFD
ncbi:DUF3108 domain-containing protein [Pseudotenacibaculum sp. MALMAid0570]|uniref:DUF3108 domain-containing protein n=1 Tax=Pseudotenacibaculum sp. MALMAid0570 TaxID=3143938 RepID=UPI0032DF84D5